MNRITYELKIISNNALIQEFYDVTDGKELLDRFKNFLELCKDEILLKYNWAQLNSKKDNPNIYSISINFSKYQFEFVCSNDLCEEIKSMLQPFIKRNRDSQQKS